MKVWDEGGGPGWRSRVELQVYVTYLSSMVVVLYHLSLCQACQALQFVLNLYYDIPISAAVVCFLLKVYVLYDTISYV
jgi:hypothetical protein